MVGDCRHAVRDGDGEQGEEVFEGAAGGVGVHFILAFVKLLL